MGAPITIFFLVLQEIASYRQNILHIYELSLDYNLLKDWSIFD